MYFLTGRTQNKVSLFTDVSPWQVLSIHGGFDYTGDSYSDNAFGVGASRTYSPSVGFLFSPADWLKFFADYNFDWSKWNQPYNSTYSSRGIDKINSLSVGSDVDIVKDLLAFRIQYGFSQGLSQISNRLAGTPGERTLYPNNSNTWQELLTRIQYQIHKNVALQVGYYFNKFSSKDAGVDIMRLWMGDSTSISDAANSGIIRSVFMGDRFKEPYSAHVALLGVKLKF